MPENSAGSEDGVGEVRPLRRDAERNRQRILKAASEVFNERGLEVSLDEIARYAGVGVGTVYRRFRTKEELVGALFKERIDSVAALAEEALQAPDPWSGLVSFMEQMAELIVFLLAEATQLAHSASPGIWRRYLALILDGMRLGREGVTPLPVAALLPEEMEKSMRQAAPRHR